MDQLLKSQTKAARQEIWIGGVCLGIAQLSVAIALFTSAVPATSIPFFLAGLFMIGWNGYRAMRSQA